ncbi:hypothetical protein BH10CYA1_BH10CYA1_09590 [soil metagenome]
MRNFSITKRMLLFIIIPLLIENVFFVVLIGQFHELQKDLETEAHAVDSSVLVNRILTGAMTAAGNLFSSKAFNQPSLYTAALGEFAQCDENIAELQALTKGDDRSAISGFLSVISETHSMFQQANIDAHEDEFMVEGLKMAGQAKSFLRRVQVSGVKVIEEQRKLCAIVREKQRRARQNIEIVLQAAAFTNLLLAALAIAIFGLTLGRRFRHVFENTILIASNKPLKQPLKGTDELSRLDQVIHEMDKELTLTRMRERAIIDNTAEIICSLDSACRIVDVNSAVRKRLGYEQEDFRGSNFQLHVVESERESAYKNLMQAMGAEDEHMFEAQLIGADGKVRDIEVVAQWSEHDQGLFCILRDVSLKKEAERLKQEVVAMVSHDLRAPLTSIGMSLEMLLDGLFGAINERGMKVASAAQQSVGSLMTLINDLLDIERVESTGIQLYYEDAEASMLLSRAADTVRTQAESKNIRLDAESNVALACRIDVERVNRVIVNLLSNAIKFAPNNSTVSLTCAKIDDQIEFRIADQGPGIPADKISIVFEKFRQVGTGSTGEKQGSGLGLAICKSLVEAHGGSIGVISESNRGSIFWFRLPIAAIAETASSRR